MKKLQIFALVSLFSTALLFSCEKKSCEKKCHKEKECHMKDTKNESSENAK